MNSTTKSIIAATAGAVTAATVIIGFLKTRPLTIEIIESHEFDDLPLTKFKKAAKKAKRIKQGTPDDSDKKRHNPVIQTLIDATDDEYNTICRCARRESLEWLEKNGYGIHTTLKIKLTPSPNPPAFDPERYLGRKIGNKQNDCDKNADPCINCVCNDIDDECSICCKECEYNDF